MKCPGLVADDLSGFWRFSKPGNRDATRGTDGTVSGGIAAVSGWAVGWLDNTHLLIEKSIASSYSSSVIVDQTGVTVNTPTPHDFEDPVQILGLDSIYDVSKNTIFSVSTGTATWTSETLSIGLGAVAAASVVFVSGNLVISEPL